MLRPPRPWVEAAALLQRVPEQGLPGRSCLLWLNAAQRPGRDEGNFEVRGCVGVSFRSSPYGEACMETGGTQRRPGCVLAQGLPGTEAGAGTV